MSIADKSTTVNTTPSTVEAFLQAVYAGGTYRHVQGFGKKRQSLWGKAADPIKIPVSWAGTNNVYFTPCPVTHIVTDADRQRRPGASDAAIAPWIATKNATVELVNVIPVEFDGKDETAPSEADIQSIFDGLRADPERVSYGDKALWNEATGAAKKREFLRDPEKYMGMSWARIERLPIQPSVIVLSGGGFHAYWLLDTPWQIAGVDGAYEAFRLFKAAFVCAVGGDEGSKDPRHLLRVPGYKNIKPAYAPDYPTVRFVEYDLDRRYSIETLSTLLPAEPVVSTPAVAVTGTRTASTTSAPLEYSRHTYRVMGAVNERHDIVSTMQRYGYTDQGSDRMSRPGEPSSRGVSILEGRAYIHSSGDPLYEANGRHRLSSYDVIAHMDYAGDYERAAVAEGRKLGILAPAEAVALISSMRMFLLTTDLGTYVPDELKAKTRFGLQYRPRNDDVKRFTAVLNIMERAERIDDVSINAYAVVRGVNSDGLPVQRESHKNVAAFFKRMSHFFDLKPVAAPNTWLVTLKCVVDVNTFPPSNYLEGTSGKVLTSTFQRLMNDDAYTTGTSLIVRDRLRAEVLTEATDTDEATAKTLYYTKLESLLPGGPALAIPAIELLTEAGDDGMDTNEIAEALDLTKGAVARLTRWLRSCGLLASQRRHMAASLHRIDPAAFEWLRNNPDQFRTAGAGVAWLDRALQQAQNRAEVAIEQSNDVADVTANRRLEKVKQQRRQTVAYLIGGTAKEIDERIDRGGVWRCWTGTVFAAPRQKRRHAQPLAANGRIVIPAQAIDHKNSRLSSELAGGEVYIPATGDLGYALGYLMRERLGASMSPEAATEFLQSIDRLGVAAEIDAAPDHTAAITFLQSRQIVTSQRVELWPGGNYGN